MATHHHAYLFRIMGGSGMSKAAEGRVKVREHARSKPGVAVMREKPVAGAEPVKKPNIEGNESARYEAMEKKSLKGLKGGGTEKELRAGHNEVLSSAARKALPKSAFATPPTKAAKEKGMKGSYPIPDAAHARNALARVAAHGTPAQKAAVRAKVRKKFPAIGRK